MDQSSQEASRRIQEGIAGRFFERVAIKAICGERSEYESVRDAFFEAKRECQSLGVEIPDSVKSLWKTTYDKELKGK
jgi:hypothetical protein